MKARSSIIALRRGSRNFGSHRFAPVLFRMFSNEPRIKISSFQNNPVSEEQKLALQERQEKIVTLMDAKIEIYPPVINSYLKYLYHEENDLILSKMQELLNKITSYYHSEEYPGQCRFFKEYAADWLAIFQFLHHDDMVNMYLDDLENSLQDYAMRLPPTEQLSVMEDGRYELPASLTQLDQRRHILSGFLYQWAKENGFLKVVKITKILSEDEFRYMITKGSFFKDNAIFPGSDGHGNWSHAIQLYSVFRHQQATSFIQHTPIEVYKSFGERPPPLGNSLWDDVFDELRDRRFFNSPEVITKTLTTAESLERWPLLAGSVQRCEVKMEKWRKNKFSEFYFDHIEKKYGKAGVIVRDNETSNTKPKT